MRAQNFGPPLHKILNPPLQGVRMVPIVPYVPTVPIVSMSMVPRVPMVPMMSMCLCLSILP